VNVNGHQAVGETDQAEIAAGASRAYRYDDIGVVNTPGNLGLQIHGGQRPMDVRFKNIAILEGCTDNTKPGFDNVASVPGLAKQPAVLQHNPALCNPSAIGGAGSPLRGRLGAVTRNGDRLEVEVTHPGDHVLEVVSLEGRTVFSGSAPAAHVYRFAAPARAGVYLATLKADGRTASRKIVVP
jgi:hypothetical protein